MNTTSLTLGHKILLVAGVALCAALFSATTAQAEESQQSDYQNYTEIYSQPTANPEGDCIGDDGVSLVVCTDEVSFADGDIVPEIVESTEPEVVVPDGFYAWLEAEATKYPERGVGVGWDKSGITLDVHSKDLEFFQELFAEPLAKHYFSILNDLDGMLARPESGWDGGQTLGTTCTGGFAGYLGSIPGMITARHCIDGMVDPQAATSYLGNTFIAVVVPTDNTDIAFAMMNAAPSGLVRTNGINYEPMYFMQMPVMGQTACHYGVETGYSCSPVLLASSIYQ